MEYIEPYGDSRHLQYCLYYGGPPATREHVPPRVFLEKPYPKNLHQVPACASCNQGYSMDEEYLACLIECVKAGEVDADKIRSAKVSRLIAAKPKLASRLAAARQVDGDRIVWKVEYDRITRIVEKIARGHALYELDESDSGAEVTVWYSPLCEMSDEAIDSFETLSSGLALWPEVGSRAMQRIFVAESSAYSPWVDVQPHRYRFLATADPLPTVRTVIGNYLATSVSWTG